MFFFSKNDNIVCFCAMERLPITFSHAKNNIGKMQCYVLQQWYINWPCSKMILNIHMKSQTSLCQWCSCFAHYYHIIAYHSLLCNRLDLCKRRFKKNLPEDYFIFIASVNAPRLHLSPGKADRRQIISTFITLLPSVTLYSVMGNIYRRWQTLLYFIQRFSDQHCEHFSSVLHTGLQQ